MMTRYNFIYAGGFGGNIGHDPYVQYTLSAVQVLVLFNKIDVLDADKVASCILIAHIVAHLFVKF